jgi:hypothetical protein
MLVVKKHKDKTLLKEKNRKNNGNTIDRSRNL